MTKLPTQNSLQKLSLQDTHLRFASQDKSGKTFLAINIKNTLVLRAAKKAAGWKLNWFVAVHSS